MIAMQWSDSGPAGEENAWGTVVGTWADGSVVPVICQHGGSMWLCRKCADGILAASDGSVHGVRKATADEYKKLMRDHYRR